MSNCSPVWAFSRVLFLIPVVLGCLGSGNVEASAQTEDQAMTEETLRAHVRILASEIGDRSVFRPRHLERAAEYVQSSLTESGLTVERQQYRYEGLEVANLIGEFPGQSVGKRYYVVGAHYDTVSGTPGADDNASAVAVLLALAERIAIRPVRIPLKFIAFTLEEPPAFNTSLQGSRVYARRAKEAGDEVLGAIVLEMVGYTSPKQEYPVFLKWAGYPDEGNFLGIVGNWGGRKFGRAVLNGFQRNSSLPAESLFVPLRGWVLPATRLSDHASFWDKGWPAVMITDTAFFRNPNYHSGSDTAATLDYAFMTQLVDSLELALRDLDDL